MRRTAALPIGGAFGTEQPCADRAAVGALAAALSVRMPAAARIGCRHHGLWFIVSLQAAASRTAHVRQYRRARPGARCRARTSSRGHGRRAECTYTYSARGLMAGAGA